MTPSNANTSGLEVVAFLLFNEHGHTKASTMPPADGGDVAAYEPLVTAASAQARITELEAERDDVAALREAIFRVILNEGGVMVAPGEEPDAIRRIIDGATAAEARADRLAASLIEALPYVESCEYDNGYKPGAVLRVVKNIRAALQQEG